MSNHFIIIVFCVSSVISSINIRRTGWLDRVVEYYKNRFYNDLRKAPLVKIKEIIQPTTTNHNNMFIATARIDRPPPGYTDSSLWDFNSVIRLLTLIRKSEDSIDVRRAITRSMIGTRRFMSIAESLKAFPSLAKNHASDFYYSIDSGEYYAELANDTYRPLLDDDIIIVSNPVEARLPSARISVHLLKSILENRAEAGRYMTKTVKTISWMPISSSKENATQDTSSAAVTEPAGVTGGNATGAVATGAT